MKVKNYVVAAIALLVVASASAAVAREYFDKVKHETIPEQKTVEATEPQAKMHDCNGHPRHEYPVNPQNKKRKQAIFYWTYKSDESFKDTPHHRQREHIEGEEVKYVSKYPCSRCVLNTRGQYEYRPTGAK